MESEAMKRWGKLIDEKRLPYIRFMNQFNAQIDIKVMKLDEDIIQLRKGERVSAGFAQQKPQREMNNVPEKKEMFNPIIWYNGMLEIQMRMYPYSNNLATLFILSDLNSVCYSLDIHSVPYFV
ncbi:hypothetical protein DAPPUDRAFT_322038 [Daphnia pulex]|uniref:Uncharacterized protein n=1 Tax=Daphnia pulex TaxID=6669 RepID=E9GUE7_DAPPU|nr:hypothetical protein DAPPUDRAFT_322038 [Daphnia pulex]|eukprot:EFX76819.1 hypothetical protein DAPPUDRAFT_322038 [Daphnia pulex]